MNSTIQTIFSTSSYQNCTSILKTISHFIIKPFNSSNKNMNCSLVTWRTKACSIKICIFIITMKKKAILPDSLTDSSWNGMMSYYLNTILIMKKLKRTVCLNKSNLSMSKVILMDLICLILVSSLTFIQIDQRYQTWNLS